MPSEGAGARLAAEAEAALCAHATACAAQARQRHGDLDLNTLPALLADRHAVRHPTTVAFDADPLQPGETAHVVPRGTLPADGFTVVVHPLFQVRPDAVVALVAYQLVRVNYGAAATPAAAEAFGAALLGLERQAYYSRMCALGDQLLAIRTDVLSGVLCNR